MDTIVALASGSGLAGVAVIRVSGPGADSVLAALCPGPLPPHRRVRLCSLRDPEGAVLDQALVLRFATGASYTGEPVVELQCHGGRAVVRAVMAAVLRQPGCRLAEPGEFTRRAFLAGRMDLAEVEALGDLLAAETEAQRRQAMRGLGGALHALTQSWRVDLLRAAALIEVTIDWADEAVPHDVGPEVAVLIGGVRAGLARQLSGARTAEQVRSGFEVALVGAPNAGKSSLLNALAGREAALTSPIAGTTRDVIELRYDLGGVPVVFLDMAGLRDTADPVEAMGVAAARRRAEAAALRLFLAAPGIGAVGDVARQPGDIAVWCKADVAGGPGDAAVSARTGAGIEALVARIGAALAPRLAEPGLVGHMRQQQAVADALACLAAVEGPPEVMAEQLRAATRALARLIGRVEVEDVLGAVFGAFCLGK